MRKRRVGMRSLVTAALVVAASLVGAAAASAQDTTAPFSECPAVGDNTGGCRILIVITPNGIQYLEDTNQPATYDGDDDTLVGVVNTRPGQPINFIDLSSPTLPIFGFDGDGICTQTPAPPPDGQLTCPFDPTGYGGPNVSFSNISPDTRSGRVNFGAGGLALNETAYFGLEDTVAVSDLTGLETHVSTQFAAVGGSGVTDSAVIEDDDPNDNSFPTGSITWNVYGPDDFTCSGDPVDTFFTTISSSGTYTTPVFFPGLAGVYTFVASFASENNDFPSLTSGCQDPDETFSVGPKLTTEALTTATVGQTIHDTATLSGARDPVGRITFTAFGPDDPDCSGPAQFIVDAPVQTGNGTYLSREFTTTQAGTYRWIARWEGDARNPPVETSCNDPNETTVVNPLPPIVVVPAHATGHARFKVKYARVIKVRGKAPYLQVRVTSKRAKYVRLRIQLSAKHWTGQRVTRKIRTNRAVKIRGLHLIGAAKVKVTVLGR
jgi:hypothetical protein